MKYRIYEGFKFSRKSYKARYRMVGRLKRWHWIMDGYDRAQFDTPEDAKETLKKIAESPDAPDSYWLYEEGEM